VLYSQGALRPPFLFASIAIAWPDQLVQADPTRWVDWSLSELAIGVRVGSNPRVLEAALLARRHMCPAESVQCLQLLAWLRFNCCDRKAFAASLASLRQLAPDDMETRVLTLMGWLWGGDLQAIGSAPSMLWRGEQQSLLLKLCRIAYLLKSNDLVAAQHLLDVLAVPLPLEACLLQARLLSRQGNEQAALDLLRPLTVRAPRHLRLFRQLLNHMIDGKDSAHVLPCAKEALNRFGEHPELLYHVTTLNLYQRHPGLARRSALLQQASASVRHTLINLGNQLSTYEMNGQANWLDAVLPYVFNVALVHEPQLQANLTMQYASIQSPRYPDHVQSLVNQLEAWPGYRQVYRNSRDLLGQAKVLPANGRSLRIAWVTGDCAYHPVSRFLFGFLSASQGQRGHQHEVVSLVDNGKESMASAFAFLNGVTVKDVSSLGTRQRLADLRDQHYDFAIDLSGWTGGNYLAGFHARIAPVQVNYLGYFASSGLPTMDYWLGDCALFPEGHAEWSTETLWRLTRPFLAWQPVDPLPEAAIAVAPPPAGAIRFGSFNHNRKLSDDTLQLWARVLAAVPDARLTLKAAAVGDADTQRLLRRRILRQGIDPERIDWLPLAKGPVEHMQQYARMDIALDPIPNGGCTTTCEALWMGVPTITMAGSHYVSRMSTAVLTGAGLNDWIAADANHYVQLAQRWAADVSSLRGQRSRWREQLQASPLGDAADLMRHLEAGFSAMHAQLLSRV
jgi:protein O-GlcNAc transferase